MMNTQVNVIIVNYNGLHFLPECLNRLRQQVFSPFRITLVDNGSDDGSVAFVKSRFPEVRIIALSKNLGFARANNIAMEKSRTRFVALLNNDAVPHPLWLKCLYQAMVRHPEAGSAASKMLLHENPEKIDRAGDAYTRAGTGELRGHLKPAGQFDRPEWIFGACAGAAIYRMDMLRKIGFFDQDFFLLYEDVDLSFRAQLNGYRCLYVPQAVVYHRGSGTIALDSPVSVYYSHRNLEWVYLKNMPSTLILRTIIPHLIYNIASCFYFMIKGRGGAFIRAKRDALKGLNTILFKRRQIHAFKSVNDRDIWKLMDKERLFHRLARRYKRHMD